MGYTVTPYDSYKEKRPQIDVGALIYHPEKDRDIVMQTLSFIQPASKQRILLRVNNHGIEAAKLAVILADLLADNLITCFERERKPGPGHRVIKKTETIYKLTGK